MKVRHRGIGRACPRQTRLPRSRSQTTPAWPIPIGVSTVVPAKRHIISSLKSYAQLRLILSAFDPDIATAVEAPAILPSLKVKTARSWRGIVAFVRLAHGRGV